MSEQADGDEVVIVQEWAETSCVFSVFRAPFQPGDRNYCVRYGCPSAEAAQEWAESQGFKVIPRANRFAKQGQKPQRMTKRNNHSLFPSKSV